MNEQYILQQSELGMNVELLLPKKPSYQGVLYTTLTEGFDKTKVTEYLEDPDRKVKIIEYLGEHISLEPINYDWYSNKIGKIFKGYSMYEIDGVFCGEERNGSVDIFEERTQVIRLIFRLPHQKLEEIRESVDKVHLFDIIHKAQLSDLNTYFNKTEQGIEYFLTNWVKIVTFFVYGYVMYRIQEHILELRDKEYEIWVVSSPAVIINKSKFKSG